MRMETKFRRMEEMLPLHTDTVISGRVILCFFFVFVLFFLPAFSFSFFFHLFLFYFVFLVAPRIDEGKKLRCIGCQDKVNVFYFSICL